MIDLFVPGIYIFQMSHSEKIILIIESNGMVQEIIGFILENRGFRALPVKDCDEAIRVLNSMETIEDIKLIILDSFQPSEGRKFLKQVKESFPKFYERTPWLFSERGSQRNAFH